MSTADLAALHGPEWSLVLEMRDGAAPVWRHLGARLDPGALPRLADIRGAATYSLEGDHAMQLLPPAGSGWFGPSAVELRDSDGNAILLRFEEAGAEQGADSLAVDLADGCAQIACRTRFRALPGGGLEAVCSVRNNGERPVYVDRLSSGMIPLPAESQAILSWRGRHNAEFAECHEPMPEHGWVRETRRGIPGHGGPCGAYVLGRNADWHAGEVLAMQLAWSGDARLCVERDDEGFWTACAEAVLRPGEVVLQPGETYAAPPLLIALSQAGRNGAMAQMHAALRAGLEWPGGEMAPRPVHLNSWEAVYFDHSEPRMMRLAEAAAELGAERFVLDDGWFRGRSDDTSSLGDWEADPAKYPQGLGPLASHVTGLGMQFGLWVEPEMVNPDSELLRAHPDWALGDEKSPTARNQLVLDLRRRKVRDYLFARLDALLSELPVSYLKWDHNRDHAPSGGIAQVEGAYDLLRRIRAAHPSVEIESCAGGGGRIDAGIARYTHRFWVSDNTDPAARIAMQRGFLAFMPPEVMGAHVGASPSHATGRMHRLDFRAAIASQGHFGVELDPDAMSDRDRDRLRDWIAFYRQWRGIALGGEVQLGEAADGLVWQAQGDGTDYLLWIIRHPHPQDRRAQPVRLPFAKDRDWQVQLVRTAVAGGVLTPRSAPAISAMEHSPQSFTGSWLAHHGLPVPSLPADSALIFHLKARS